MGSSVAIDMELEESRDISQRWKVNRIKNVNSSTMFSNLVNYFQNLLTTSVNEHVWTFVISKRTSLHVTNVSVTSKPFTA